MPPGLYRATTCRGRELNYGSHTYFFDHTRTWRASPEEWSAQCRGHLRDSTNMKDNTHQAHTQSSQQGEDGMMITTTAKWYSGTLGAWNFLTFVLQVRKNPKKNLTQETCHDRGSNPGPLRDKRACYHLLHSGGHIQIICNYVIIYLKNMLITQLQCMHIKDIFKLSNMKSGTFCFSLNRKTEVHLLSFMVVITRRFK